MTNSSSSSSSSSPKIKAAVLDRPRRSTAGQRLSSLVGKAQEEDETFWSHSIWNEKGGGFADNKRKKKRRRRNDDDGDGDDEDEEESESSSSEGEGSSNGNNDEDESDDDGEGSYRMSEDDSSMAQDQFDSDFDESESDDDEVTGEDGEARMGEEEYELLAEERRDAANLKRKKNQRFSLSAVPPLPSTAAAAGRQMGKKKGKKGASSSSSSKRGPMGTGLNEGLVLNWNAPQYPLPSRQSLGAGAMIGLPAPSTSTPSTSTTMPIPSTMTVPTLSQSSELPTMSIPPGATTVTQPISERPPLSSSDDAQQRNDGILAQPQPIHNLRTSSLPSSSAVVTAAPLKSASSVKPPSPTKRQQQKQLIITKQQQQQQSISERKQSQRRQYTQEELILEAVQCTETTNAKWLHARQRSKEEAATLEKSSEKSTKHSNTNHKLVSRFYSRRGCNNTLTFMDMDHLPEILVRGGGGHHPRRARASSFSSSNHTSIAGPIASPSSRPLVGATSTSLEANESMQQHPPSPPSSQQHRSPNNDTPERNHEKCIITGKIAKYRDPKSMLGYHDIEAYKELKRKLESGEIVPKINHAQNNATEKHSSAKGKGGTISSTTSQKRGGAKAKGAAVATINYFPFAENQPTMIATITSSPSSSSITKGIDSVKVMVTQMGLPVSPPSSPPQPASRSVEQPTNLSEDDRKQPPPELILSTEHNGNVESSATLTNNVPTSAPMNEVQATSRTTESAQPMILSANPLVDQTNTLGARDGSIDTIANDSENGNRHEDDGVKSIIVNVSNGSDSASDTVRIAEIGTTTTATTNINGGSGANGASGTREKILVPTTPSAPMISSNNNKSSDGAADKVIVPDVTTSNDKRTTIEAN
ncbi:hypothetical protein ACHAWU_002554 [Discostella pseudostelligera]|uniref:Vps72/YL1 C-terminal domain-containing protein n=1 Tax=Discostella pseudostelligera TaxID=259834 RepID=A0ABD3M3N1_9STRA